MGTDDFFGDKKDRTILRPTPGRGRPDPGGRSARQPGASRPAQPVSTEQISAVGINPLIAAAGSLFSLATQLRNTTSHPDVASLSTHVAQDVNAFEAAARSSGENQEAILAARYALCTLLDEIVLSTPWGTESAWANETLLIRFHNEAWGGEKFFKVLERGLQDPGNNLHLLEFMYVCMALGLAGRYRVQENGRQRLQSIMDQTYESIRIYRGDFERELSPHWQGVEDKRPKLSRYVPLWAICAAAAGVLMLVYAGFLWALNVESDPVVAQISALGRESVQLDSRPASLPAQQISLADLLTTDINEGFVQVDDYPGRSVVTMWALFPSGQAKVDPQHNGRIERVANALRQFPGAVTLTGHTDDVPIRSLRFPSNWILAERRAESVYRLLVKTLPAERIRFEGLADTNPLVPNDSADNRFINRRVEITLYPDAKEL